MTSDESLRLCRQRWTRKGPIARLFDWLLVKQPSWFTSFCFHVVLLIVLGLFVIPVSVRNQITLALGSTDADEYELHELVIAAPVEPIEPAAEPEDAAAAFVPLDAIPFSALSIELSVDTFTAPTASNGLSGNARDALNIGTPGGMAGRLARRGNAQRFGASKESEEAVERALKWLAVHQNYDGSWTFDLDSGRCRGACSHPGTGGLARNAATALGLLPFLGAGNTSHAGEYRETVSSALDYLIDHQQRDGSFHEPQGTMYSHGLAALALCEATAMTADAKSRSTSHRRRNQKLRDAAQRAIDFIVQAQHRGGGWRYDPMQRGDTSVVGWQAMALQSGRMAGLRTPEHTFSGISEFLDAVSSDHYGATYGYQDSTPRPGTTAVGLLCRMYLGWDRTHPGITNGAEHLSQLGPSSNNVYFDYYATQVMHHYQGPLWDRWNAMLRDHLVQTQVNNGHEAGSWYFDDDFGSGIGGRLYITAMATMILEVYYRHMPIYSREAVAEAAPAGRLK